MYNLISRQTVFKLSRCLVSPNNRHFHSSTDHYANHLEIYGRDRSLRSGKLLHAYLIIVGLAHSQYLASKLITFYTQCRRIHDARKLFDQMPETTDSSRWIVLIGTYSRQGFYQETLQLFVEMKRKGLKPNHFIFPSTLKACAHLLDRRTGERIHGMILRSLLEADQFIDSSLIDMYSKCGAIEKARLIFDRMVDKDMVTWNVMISGYAQQGCPTEALGLVDKMKLRGLKPNLVSWNALIAGFSQVGDGEMALNLLQAMQADGVVPDVVSWTSVLSGFVRNFQNEKAFCIFKQMMAAGVRPSSFTISSLLSACATVADLKHGRKLHGHALAARMEDDVFVCSSLIDMYAKCGSIFEAKMLFDKMREKNTVTWNSMIFGFANHGYCSEALELFNQMLNKVNAKPDHLSFTAALTACSHAGMVSVGWNVFNLMQEEYRSEPRLEHYACMVDILGRAGEVSEAYGLIKTMPIEPDSFVWGALLGACRTHGNVELAEVAAKNLNKLEPVSKGSRLLLSNLYADVGKWSDAERLKKMTKRKRFRTNTAHSWIETV